jgi:hypothetical protein
MCNAERRGVAAQAGETLQQLCVRSASEQRSEQRVLLRPRCGDVVGRLLVLFGLSVEVGPQDLAVDAGRCLDNEHTLGRNSRPVGHRRLRDTNLAREFTDAADGAYSFLEAGVTHPDTRFK